MSVYVSNMSVLCQYIRQAFKNIMLIIRYLQYNICLMSVDNRIISSKICKYDKNDVSLHHQNQ